MRFLSLDCIANRAGEQTRKESVALFNKAKHSIKIIAGDLDADFYRDGEVVDSFKNAIGRGVDVEIAYHPAVGHGKRSNKIERKVPGLKIWSLKEPPLRHMTSIDTKHVRIEKRHSINVKSTPAIICKNASILARDVDAVFTALTKTE